MKRVASMMSFGTKGKLLPGKRYLLPVGMNFQKKPYQTEAYTCRRFYIANRFNTQPPLEFSALSRWEKALSDIPIIQLDNNPPPVKSNPLSDNLESAQQPQHTPTNVSPRRKIYVQALLGDKLLDLAVARQLMEKTATTPKMIDTGLLTKIIAATVSNRSLARHAKKLLLAAWPDLDLQAYSEWEKGTLVEAAVYAVYEVDPGAVQALATYLLEESSLLNVDGGTRDAKSQLLELGGTIKAQRKGGVDHQPIFEAEATLQGYTRTSHGPSKKRAEMKAAAYVLQASGVTFVDHEWWNPPTEVFNYNNWEAFELADRDVKLEGGETLIEWWRRGATVPKLAFERAVMAPWIFSDSISAMDSWVWRPEQGGEVAVFAMIVTTGGKYHTVPAVTASSANQARRVIGLESNRIVSEIVGIGLE